MPRKGRVYTVGNDSSNNTYAQKLGKVFYPEKEIEVADLATDGCMDGVETEQLKSLVYLGHGCTTDYGGYTPKEFAKRLAKQFPKEQMLLLEHLYLIGCDTGLIQEDGSTLAQQIANELHDAGFKNVQIHTVAKPENASGEALYVEVIDKPGFSSLLGVQEGYINAFLLTGDDSKRFDELKDEPKRWRERAKIKDEKAFTFIKGANPEVELNKPHNIFIPYEEPLMRMKRIESHPYTKLSKEQEVALDLLRQRREHELHKNDKKMVRKLDFIIVQLARAQPTDWQRLMKDFVTYLEVSILGITVNRSSNTLKLLKHLAAADFEAADQLIKKQQEKDQSEATGEHKSTGAKVLDKMKRAEKKLEKKVDDVVHKKDKKDKREDKREAKETDALLPKKDSKGTPDSVAKGLTSDSGQQEKKPPKPPILTPLKEMIQHAKAQEAIQILIDILNNEIEALCSKCLSLLYQYEINTKIAKRDELIELKKIQTFGGMRQKAAELMMQPDSRVMRSKKTKRTHDLLNDLVNHTEKFYDKRNELQTTKVIN